MNCNTIILSFWNATKGLASLTYLGELTRPGKLQLSGGFRERYKTRQGASASREPREQKKCFLPLRILLQGKTNAEHSLVFQIFRHLKYDWFLTCPVWGIEGIVTILMTETTKKRDLYWLRSLTVLQTITSGTKDYKLMRMKTPKAF